MTYLPTKRDDNGQLLNGHGSEVLTKRFAAVDTDGQDISVGLDIKAYCLHIEGSTVIAEETGAATGSTEIFWTSDGTTLPVIYVAAEADATLTTIAAPSDTINVSLIAWR